MKALESEDMNFVFNKETGFTATWGRTPKDDPEYCPFGPMILDVEVSTICHQACPFCYKSNTAKGKNMTFDTFKIILDKMPKTLTQIAIGIGSIDANPDLFMMMNYSRSKGIIPNITINGERMTDSFYDRLATTCGAVAVSIYDKNTCYNAVKALTDRGMKQVNIHCLASSSNFDNCVGVLSDKQSDLRLKKLNAIVFLALKRVGRGESSIPLNMNQYKIIINTALDKNIAIGFDSCSAPYFLEVVKDSPRIDEFKQICEPCESGIFSLYVDVNGVAHPCSFSAHEKQYSLNILEVNDFVRDVWFSNNLVNFRNRCLASKHHNGCRKCSLFDLGIE